MIISTFYSFFSYNLYLKQTFKHDKYWIFEIFDEKLEWIYFALFILLILTKYGYEKIRFDYLKKGNSFRNIKITEYCFHTFGLLTNQSI